MIEKPHHGRIKSWRKEVADAGLGYLIVGEFLDHPYYRGLFCHTSFVVKHDEETGEIETANSRYKLVSEGEPSRMPGFPWKGDKLVFLGKNGYDHQLEEAKKVFKVGELYEVEDVEVGAWDHTIAFVGIKGRYNGVMFGVA